MSSPVADIPQTAPVDVQKTKTKKPKKTFMLHKPETFESLGKFVSTDFRYAALKAASRGHKDIYLRITDTKLVYQFEGSIQELDTPQIVKRGEREIKYTKKPIVKYVRKFIFDDKILEKAADADANPDALPDNPKVDGEGAPKKTKKRKNAAPEPETVTTSEGSQQTAA